MFTRYLIIVAAMAAPSIAVAAPRAASPSNAPAASAQKPMTRAEFIANVQARFKAMDTNHDGVLNSAEVAAAQQKEIAEATAVEQQRAETEFTRLDTNHDGQLSKAEFMAAVPAVKPNQSPQQIIASFDSNKDGKISTQEYDAKPVASFDRIDTNHDGMISPQELQAARSQR